MNKFKVGDRVLVLDLEKGTVDTVIATETGYIYLVAVTEGLSEGTTQRYEEFMLNEIVEEQSQ